MSLYNVGKSLTGEFPGTPIDYALARVKDALGKIYDDRDWSWSRMFGGWLCPGQVLSSGTFTTTPYQTQVVADATATAAIQAFVGLGVPPLITQLQFRNLSYSVYNIVSYDYNNINPGFVTLTLDRPWLEPLTGPGMPYSIYQCYFPATVSDFRKWIEIRDTTNDTPINFWSMTQAELAVKDPQRSEFSNSLYCVPIGIDQRPGSATLGYQMFEMWPHQLSYIPYSFSFRRKGPLPQSQSDYQTMTTPYPITEEMLTWRAKEMICQFKEAQKDRATPRGSGANWIMLAQMAKAEYQELFDKALAIDLNLDNEDMNYAQPNRNSRRDIATMNKGLVLGGY